MNRVRIGLSRNRAKAAIKSTTGTHPEPGLKRSHSNFDSERSTSVTSNPAVNDASDNIRNYVNLKDHLKAHTFGA